MLDFIQDGICTFLIQECSTLKFHFCYLFLSLKWSFSFFFFSPLLFRNTNDWLELVKRQICWQVSLDFNFIRSVWHYSNVTLKRWDTHTIEKRNAERKEDQRYFSPKSNPMHLTCHGPLWENDLSFLSCCQFTVLKIAPGDVPYECSSLFYYRACIFFFLLF